MSSPEWEIEGDHLQRLWESTRFLDDFLVALGVEAKSFADFQENTTVWAVQPALSQGSRDNGSGIRSGSGTRAWALRTCMR